MQITVTGGEMTHEETMRYAEYLETKHQKNLTELNIKIDGEYVELGGKFSSRPFDRIRRITGYLVGTMDRWNGAKAAEENDRVKHG